MLGLRRGAVVLCLLSFAGCAGTAGRMRRAVHFAGYLVTGKAPDTECWSGGPYRACRYRSRSGPTDEKALVWFFHYAEGDEKSFGQIGLARAFFKRFAEARRPAPAVVSVSYGSHWLLSETQGTRQIVLIPAFEREAMAEVEKRTSAPERRFAWGLSMGGYNASELALRRPGLFSRVVASCPALYPNDPFTVKGKTGQEEEGRDLFRHRMDGSGHWAKDDPISLAKAAKAGARFLIQPNRKDEYRFQDGARAFAAALDGRGVLEEGPGGHCVVDARQAADFLLAR